MLDVQDLIRRDQPIYVRNRTADFLPKQGPYVLEIRSPGKQAISIVIPATRFPFLLSAQVPTQLLGESPEFYAVLSKGILELLDPEEARKESADPIAQKVLAAAMRKFQPTKRTERPPPELVTANNRADRVPPGADRGIDGLSTENRTPLCVADSITENPGVNPTVLQIVMDLQSDPGLRNEKFLELAGMEGLEQDDLGYLLGSCQPFPKVTQWARDALAELVGDEEAAEIVAEQETAADVEEAKKAPRSTRRKRRR